MQRDSRLWQDSTAVTPIFDGDPNECSRWVGFAMTKLKFMLSVRPGPSSETLTPVDGVEIHIDARPNKIRIKAGGGIYVAYCDNDNELDSYIFKNGSKHSKEIPGKTLNYHVPGFVTTISFFGSSRKTYGNKNYWFDEAEKTCISWGRYNVYTNGKTYSPAVGGRIIACSKYKNNYLTVSLYEESPDEEFSVGTYSLTVLNSALVTTASYTLPYTKSQATYWGFLADGLTLIVTHHSLPDLSEQYLETLVVSNDLSGWSINNIFTSTQIVIQDDGGGDQHVTTPGEWIHDIFIHKNIVTCVVVNYHTWTTSGLIIDVQADLTVYSLINGVFSATSETNTYSYDEYYVVNGGPLNTSTMHYVMVDENNNINLLLKSNVAFSTTFNTTTTLVHGGITTTLSPFYMSSINQYKPSYLCSDEKTTKNANQRFIYSQFSHDGEIFLFANGDVYSTQPEDRSIILDTKSNVYDEYSYRIDRVPYEVSPTIYFKYLSVTNK